jgi:hypothetical protein
MKKNITVVLCIFLVASAMACSSQYKAKPMPFKMPGAYENATEVGGAVLAARAFADQKEAKEAFGFDIRKAGMLPVQVVFDNQGVNSLEVDGGQTFLEDEEGNLWPLLEARVAYERAAKYSQSANMAKEGAFHGIWGAAAGALVGAAIGIISGDNVGAAMGKGAAGGAAMGAVLGSAKGYDSSEARREISGDLKDKSLQNKPVEPMSIANGFLFFPGEASSAKQLRLKIFEKETGTSYVVNFSFPPMQ